MAKKKIEDKIDELINKPAVEAPKPIVNEKDALLALYKTLKDLGINSISDLENKISRLN